MFSIKAIPFRGFLAKVFLNFASSYRPALSISLVFISCFNLTATANPPDPRTDLVFIAEIKLTLGEAYRDGTQGFNKDLKFARNLLEHSVADTIRALDAEIPLASKDRQARVEAQAKIALGEMYLKGLGGEQELAKAGKLFFSVLLIDDISDPLQAQAEVGLGESLLFLSVLTMDDISDPLQAQAKIELGEYLQEQGDEQNLERAQRYFVSALSTNDIPDRLRIQAQRSLDTTERLLQVKYKEQIDRCINSFKNRG